MRGSFPLCFSRRPTVGFTRAAGAGKSLRHKTDYKAYEAADFGRRSRVGCKPLLARACFSLDVRLHNGALQARRSCVVGITPAVDRDVGPLPAVPLPRTGSRPLRRVAAL